MLTIFAVPKAFGGHVGMIQKNAIRSWTELAPDCEILLLGDEPGTAQAAAELDVKHCPELACNEYGTPLVSDVFERAQRVASHDRLCYANCDIVLLGDLVRAATTVAGLPPPLLLAGRRWRTVVDRPLDFRSGWQDRLRRHVVATAWLDSVVAIDWLVFDRGLFSTLPDFALGRTRWDTWLLGEARARNALLVDATEAVMAVHQEHRAGEVAPKAATRRGAEAARNRALARGRRCTLGDARYKLTERGLERARDLTRLRWRIYSTRLKGLAGLPARLLILLLGKERFLKWARTMTTPSARAGVTASVVGLGRIGGPLAACLAVRGLDVVGVDVDTAKVDAVNGGRAPVDEAGLAELVARVGSSLRATDSLRDAVLASDVTFLALPTQATADGSLAVPALMPVGREIGEALRDKPGFHLVALVSTVMPGTTGALGATIAQAAGKRDGSGFGVCFAPEFVALGTAIRDYLAPDFALLGASDRSSGDLLESVLRRVWENDPPIARTNLVAAEVAKLALNAFVATKISFANVLAQVCEALPGCDVDAVTSALGLDRRVGQGYLRGAISFGGPCFPRDTAAFATLAETCGAPVHLARAAMDVNERTLDRLLAVVQDKLPPDGCVGICGLAFKPGTAVVEASQGVALGLRLADQGVRVVGFDPLAGAGVDAAIELAPSLEHCLAQADVFVLAAPAEQFADLGASLPDRDGRPPTVIDCWRTQDPEALGDANYVAIGRGL